MAQDLPLYDETTMFGVFIAQNGPPPCATNSLLEQSLNNRFSGSNWNFVASKMGIKTRQNMYLEMQRNFLPMTSLKGSK